MGQNELFIMTDQALNGVVSQIPDDKWSLPIPGWFKVGRAQEDMTLRRIINYHAYDDAWVPDILSGKTMEEADKSKYDGDLLGDDPKGNFAALVEAACQAVAKDYDPERLTHLTYGDFPAKEYLRHITSFRFFRIYDISKLIGILPKIPEDMVQAMWDQTRPSVEEWRKMGVYGPEIKVAGDASLEDRLMGLVGREPAARNEPN